MPRNPETHTMNSNASTPVSETESAACSNSLAGCLSDFLAIAYILNTEDLFSNPSALMDFMRDSVGSWALYKVFPSLNNTCTAARNEIAINQAQLQIVNN
jgi:hypothetical protein